MTQMHMALFTKSCKWHVTLLLHCLLRKKLYFCTWDTTAYIGCEVP